MPVLNPTLYRALDRSLGPVTIAHEGCAMQKHYRETFDGRVRLEHSFAGEYYRVNCPFCNDTRQRLWINYLWGVYDEKTKSGNHWLAICYNEDCMKDPGRVEMLIELMSSYHRLARSRYVKVAEGKPPEVKIVSLPTDFVRLHELPADHRAVRYVLKRGFDPAALSKLWGVGFSCNACRWSRYGRLLIPVFRGPRGAVECCGWQARALVDDDEPKYYTADGMKKSLLLYGLHRVSGNGPVVICEGPTDVWRVGTNAVALFGKSASDEQIRLIQEHFAGRPLVVMLDGDAIMNGSHVVERLRARRHRSLTRMDSSPVVRAELRSVATPEIPSLLRSGSSLRKP